MDDLLLQEINNHNKIDENGKSHSELLIFWNNATDLYCIINYEGRIININPAFEKELGHPRNDLKGRSIDDFVHYDDQNNLRKILKYLLVTKQAASTICKFRHLDGSYRQLRLSFMANEEENKVFIVAHDITEHTRQKEELESINHHLEEVVKERTESLETAMKNMESFSFSVSHDLRAPLRAMSGFANMLQEKYGQEMNDEAKRFLNIIIAEANRMGEIINDLLAFSRMQRSVKKVQPFDSKKLVNTVFEDILFESNFREMKIDVGELPEICADYQMMKIVWTNLITNAIKYSKPDQKPEIRIWHEANTDFDTFFISDNGIGFDQDNEDRIFRVFERLDNTKEGSGIGLSIVRMVIDRHGGKVSAKGKANEGATFSFTLPRVIGRKIFQN